MSCCKNILDLGCHGSCYEITLPYNYTQTGIHTMYIENKYTIKQVVNAISGQPIIIDTSLILENSCNTIWIIQPNGTRWSVVTNIDGGLVYVTYNCFKITIKI